MSVEINIQVSDVSSLVSALEEAFSEALQADVSLGIADVGRIIVSDAQTKAPRKTGYMASQISFERTSYSTWAFKLVGRAPYTIYQELGTRYIQPRLFMTTSLQIHQQDLIQAIQNGIQQAIDEVFGT